MTAYPHFSHYIEENVFRIARTTWLKAGVDQHKEINFFTLREWFWEQLGPSKEFRYWQADQAPNVDNTNRSHNIHWCWDTEFGKQRIYVNTAALTLFNLKWM
jgi:hypothetical protein